MTLAQAITILLHPKFGDRDCIEARILLLASERIVDQIVDGVIKELPSDEEKDWADLADMFLFEIGLRPRFLPEKRPLFQDQIQELLRSDYENQS